MHQPTQYPTKVAQCSASSCSELGWLENAEVFGNDNVCAAARKSRGGARASFGFEDAREFCQSSGARLCEAHELLFGNDDARDTGCSYNREVARWCGREPLARTTSARNT